MASSAGSQQEQHLRQKTSEVHEHDSHFECSICLQEARDPVVLTCGHFYCWKCIDDWFSSAVSKSKQCPICKFDVTVEKDVIPVYGKGCESPEHVAKPRPAAPVQHRKVVNEEGAMESDAEEESLFSSDFFDVVKIGCGVIGGAIAGVLISSIFSKRNSQRNRRNSDSR